MPQKIFNAMTWAILALLLASVIAKFAGLYAPAQIMWWLAILLIVVWLIVRAKRK